MLSPMAGKQTTHKGKKGFRAPEQDGDGHFDIIRTRTIVKTLSKVEPED